MRKTPLENFNDLKGNFHEKAVSGNYQGANFYELAYIFHFLAFNFSANIR